MTVQDDFIYAALLVISLPIGILVQKTEGTRQRQLLCTTVGVVLVATVCGWHGLHSLFTLLVNCVIIRALGPTRCHTWSFIWCFGYIVFFRTTHYFGLPKVPAHANAVQLLLTLKLVGLAFEVHDSHRNKMAAEKEDDESEHARRRCRYNNIEPSLVDMLCYSYCYVGLLTGPYYKFRTYYDMINQKDVETIDFKTPLLERIKLVPLVSFVFLVLSYFFNIEYAASDEILLQPFWYRLFYMVPMFTIFRMRLYFAWIMAECVCMTAQLGAYPAASKPRCGEGPTDLKALDDVHNGKGSHINYDFTTINNLSIYGCELAPTLRDGMRSWNMSVQYWLANNVYRRVPPSLKAHRMTITMMVSSFWHGIHPGYYLSFILVPPNQLAEDWMVAAFRPKERSSGQQVFDWICWFWKQRSLDYMAMAFLLLGLHETLHYWGCIYFVGHLWVAVFMVIGYLSKPKGTGRQGRKPAVEKVNGGPASGDTEKTPILVEENQNILKKYTKSD